MRLEGLWAALGWFTALPAPKHAQPAAIGQAMPWLPAIGLGLGALYAGLAAAFGAHPLVAGWLVALASLLLTGGMHLDGLADLVDALAAAHADARRFHRVRREPTIGSLGAASIAIIVCGKAMAAAELVHASASWALVLAPAWARAAASLWLIYAPPEGASSLGQAAREGMAPAPAWIWTSALSAAMLGALGLGPLMIAWICMLLVGLVIRRWARGAHGDALGAGIECTECLLWGIFAL